MNESDDKASLCGMCHDEVVQQGVCCEICNEWYHYREKCSGLKVDMDHLDITEPLINSEQLIFLCSGCKNDARRKKLKIGIASEIEGKLDDLKTTSDNLATMVQNTADNTRSVINNIEIMQDKIDNEVRSSTDKTKSYADSLKTKKVLLIKANQENQKAADKKKAIMSKMATPVEEVKATRQDNLYLDLLIQQNSRSKERS